MIHNDLSQGPSHRPAAMDQEMLSFVRYAESRQQQQTEEPARLLSSPDFLQKLQGLQHAFKSISSRPSTPAGRSPNIASPVADLTQVTEVKADKLLNILFQCCLQTSDVCASSTEATLSTLMTIAEKRVYADDFVTIFNNYPGLTMRLADHFQSHPSKLIQLLSTLYKSNPALIPLETSKHLVLFLIDKLPTMTLEYKIHLLALLSQLCYRYTDLVPHIKQSLGSDMPSFYRQLIQTLKEEEPKVVIPSLMMMTKLSVREDISQKLFNANNIYQTVQLILNMIKIARNDPEVIENVVYVFSELFESPSIRQCLFDCEIFLLFFKHTLVKWLKSAHTPSLIHHILQLSALCLRHTFLLHYLLSDDHQSYLNEWIGALGALVDRTHSPAIATELLERLTSEALSKTTDVAHLKTLLAPLCKMLLRKMSVWVTARKEETRQETTEHSHPKPSDSQTLMDALLVLLRIALKTDLSDLPLPGHYESVTRDFYQTCGVLSETTTDRVHSHVYFLFTTLVSLHRHWRAAAQSCIDFPGLISIVVMLIDANRQQYDDLMAQCVFVLIGQPAFWGSHYEQLCQELIACFFDQSYVRDMKSNYEKELMRLQGEMDRLFQLQRHRSADALRPHCDEDSELKPLATATPLSLTTVDEDTERAWKARENEIHVREQQLALREENMHALEKRAAAAATVEQQPQADQRNKEDLIVRAQEEVDLLKGRLNVIVIELEEAYRQRKLNERECERWSRRCDEINGDKEKWTADCQALQDHVHLLTSSLNEQQQLVSRVKSASKKKVDDLNAQVRGHLKTLEEAREALAKEQRRRSVAEEKLKKYNEVGHMIHTLSGEIEKVETKEDVSFVADAKKHSVLREVPSNNIKI